VAHEIFGKRFLSNREPAWHGLGIVLEDKRVTAVEALRMMGEYSIRTEQLVTANGGLEAPRKAIIREATNKGEAEKVLGTVGPDFHPIGPLATCSIWDEAVDVPVETIGALRDGAHLFISTKLPKFSVKGDEVQDYLLVSNPMDGGESAEIIRTPVRVVCANTLRLGKQQGIEAFRIVHDENAQKRMYDWLHGLYQKAVAQQKLIKEACEVLATCKVNDSAASEILDGIYPEPKKLRVTAPSEVMKKREKHRLYAAEHMETNREQVLKLFKGNARGGDTVAAKGTAWGLYNAAVEYEDYRWARNPQQALESSVFGARAEVKDAAFEACAEFAGVRGAFGN
jgi:phage/plasmid-like protein (TIGR03299 family)